MAALPGYTVPAIAWGTNFENTLGFSWPLDNVVTDFGQRAGSEVAQAPSGVEDAWVTGRDFLMEADARWIPVSPQTSGPDAASTPWSGGVGWEAFLDWARAKNQFRFVPDATAPDFWVLSYLADPMAAPSPRNEPDGSRSVHLSLRNAALSYALAMRGLMFHYVPGADLTALGATFSRAGAVGSFVGRGGLVASAAASVLRDRHYPLYPTLTRTTLTELTGTNLALWSEDFSNAAWAKTNTIVNGTSIVGPDGASYTTVEINQNVAANGFFVQTVTDAANANQSYTFSVWLRAGTLSGNIALRIRDGAGGNDVNVVVTPTSAWRRYTVTNTFGGAPAANVQIFVDPANDAGTGTYYVWGAQLEKGTKFATSYIKTVGATASRNSDVGPTYAHPWIPQAQWMYRKWIEAGPGINTGTFRALTQVGNPAVTGNRWHMIANGAGGYYLEHYNVANANVATPSTPAGALGDVWELLGLLYADGSVDGHYSRNGGADTVLTRSAALALDAYWGATPTDTIKLAQSSDAAGSEIQADGLMELKQGVGTAVNTLALARAA